MCDVQVDDRRYVSVITPKNLNRPDLVLDQNLCADLQKPTAPVELRKERVPPYRQITQHGSSSVYQRCELS